MKIKIKNLMLNLFCIYLITKPMYLLKDSSFQIADIVLIINFFILMFYKKQPENNRKETKQIIFMYLLIVIYQVVVNIITYINVKGRTIEYFSLLRNNIYYFFNFIVIIYISNLYSKFGEDTLRYYAKGIHLSCLIILLGLIINIGKSTRNASFFTNPNQLGYYVLVIMTSVFLLKEVFTIKQKIVITIISIISLIMCGSRAAIFGFIILIMCRIISSMLRKEIKIKTKYIYCLIILIVITVILWPVLEKAFYTYKSAFINRYKQKFNESTDLGNSRGYNRIKEIGNNICWGYGEGAFYRFTTMKGNETHSSFATILVSYGLIGASLYLIFFIKSINDSKVINLINFLMIFSGILFYWLSHNGLRSSLFWIIVVIYNIQMNEKERN